MTDNRPAPKPRKYPQLWQSYLFWEEIMLMRQRHNLRISSIERGKSNLDPNFERGMMEGVLRYEGANGKAVTIEITSMDFILHHAEKMMINLGKSVPVWSWITGIRGLGAGSQAAKILALIDDIGRYDSIAKLWRYAGYGLYNYYESDGKVVAPVNGKKSEGKGDDRVVYEFSPQPQDDWNITTVRDRGVKEYVLPYNKTLKATLYVMADCMRKTHEVHYIDIWNAEKLRQRELHPEKVKVGNRVDFTDAHIDNRGRRKMIKEFLKDLWVNWRQAEGLTVTEQW